MEWSYNVDVPLDRNGAQINTLNDSLKHHAYSADQLALQPSIRKLQIRSVDQLEFQVVHNAINRHVKLRRTNNDAQELVKLLEENRMSHPTWV